MRGAICRISETILLKIWRIATFHTYSTHTLLHFQWASDEWCISSRSILDNWGKSDSCHGTCKKCDLPFVCVYFIWLMCRFKILFINPYNYFFRFFSVLENRRMLLIVIFFQICPRKNPWVIFPFFDRFLMDNYWVPIEKTRWSWTWWFK
jgi:hypothetical protein